jgi:lecithin-cholesterol acyltransferase
MLSILIFLSLSNKPVILLPGLGASLLQMTFTGVKLEWYCPTHLDHKVVLWNEEYLIPPILGCVFEWATLAYDPVTNAQKNLYDIEVDTVDWGGLGGIDHTDQTFFNISLIPYFTRIIKKLKDRGHIERFDLFGAPQDYRLGIVGMNATFDKLITLVEQAFANTGQKVVLVGHSFGGMCTQYFTDTYAPKDWVKKYIDSTVLIAPSFFGAGMTIPIAYRHVIPQFPISYPHFGELLEGFGGIHTHFPNFDLYKDDIFVIGPDDSQYTIDQVPGILFQTGKISGQNQNFIQLNSKIFRKAI